MAEKYDLTESDVNKIKEAIHGLSVKHGFDVVEFERGSDERLRANWLRVSIMLNGEELNWFVASHECLTDQGFGFVISDVSSWPEDVPQIIDEDLAHFRNEQ